MHPGHGYFGFHIAAYADECALLGAPEIEGRFFYNEDLSGFNFKAVKLKLDVMLDEVERHKDAQKPPAIYVGSTTVDTCLPGFRDENDLGFGGIGSSCAVPADAVSNTAARIARIERIVVSP